MATATKPQSRYAELKDPYFGPPFIDVDEWREKPVRHRYVHGGFKKTDTRFAIHFPPKEQFKGRFLVSEGGGSGGVETASAGYLEFAYGAGAYLVGSNQGHFGGDLSILRTEPTVHSYRAGAESARFARILATEMYGKRPRYGYVFGGSGGSPRTMISLERAQDVYNGALPYIIGHGNSWSLGFSVQANAIRVLGEKIYDVVDAMAPGGSGDPFVGLNTDEREALAALYRSGLPRGAELVFLTSGYMGTFANHIAGLLEFDTTYLDDFMTKPGYMGGDGKLASALLQQKTTVGRVVYAKELAERFGPHADNGRMRWLLRAEPDAALGIVVNGLDPKRALGASLKMLSGAAKGHELHTIAVLEDVLLGGADVPYRFEGIEPGDQISVDNRKFLAYCYFHRHQVDASAQYAPYRVDNTPVYPQRPNFAGSGGLSGAVASGEFKGKMIVIQNAHDAATLPNAAHAWRKQLEGRFGSKLEQHFRLWYNEYASHIPGSMQPPTGKVPPLARLVDYGGSLEQTLLDLMAWVEEGKEPSPSTNYEIDHDQHMTLAPTAAERHGIQPVVTAKANGAVRTEVKVGEPVSFAITAETPPGMGKIIKLEWDLENKAAWDVREPGIDGKKAKVQVKRTHAYSKPGTYFPAVRVTAHRDGDVKARFGRIMNLGRMRVVVTGSAAKGAKKAPTAKRAARSTASPTDVGTTTENTPSGLRR